MSDVSEETDSRKMEEGKVTRGEGCCVPVTKKKVQVVKQEDTVRGLGRR